jgi:hypothetical protein
MKLAAGRYPKDTFAKWGKIAKIYFGHLSEAKMREIFQG